MQIRKYTVSRDDKIYEAWPDIILTKGGKLICVFTECTHHSDRTASRIMKCESLDRGRTWSKKTPFTEITQKDYFYNNSRISRLSDDSIVIICDKVRKEESAEGITTIGTVYMWKGDSEGVCWQDPIETPAKGIVPDKLKELRSGRWILSAHEHNPKTDKLEQYLWYSDDKGETWSDRITVGADKRYNLCEVSIIELPDDTLVAFMRENSFTGISCMKSISKDGGKTWDGVYETPIPACHRPVSGLLNSGDIMITYRFMQGGKGWLGCWTQNVFAAFMDKDSAVAKKRSEQSVRILPLDYDRSSVSDLGYTGWVEFDDGEIYVVNYIVDDAPKAYIRGYSFNEDDIIIKNI